MRAVGDAGPYGCVHRGAEYPRRKRGRKTMRAVGDAGPYGVRDLRHGEISVGGVCPLGAFKRGTWERQRGWRYRRFVVGPFCAVIASGRKEFQRPWVFGGVFASFCRRGQKDVAPEREIAPPEAWKRNDAGRRGRRPLRRIRREYADIRRCADAGTIMAQGTINVARGSDSGDRSTGDSLWELFAP